MSAATTTLEQAPVHERRRPDLRGWAARGAVMVLLLGGLVFVTAAVPGFWADRIAFAAIYGIIGLSLNVILGYTGQVSLGHHAFVGSSAFVSAYFVTKVAGCDVGSCSFGDFGMGLLIAVAAGAFMAGVLGLVALRVKGLYLALITLTYGFVAVNSIFQIPVLTNGGAGMPAPRPAGFTGDTAYAFLCLGFLAAALYFDWNILRSKAGRSILAVKHSEDVAASYGVDVTAYKVIAFVLSGALAGLAGSLFAHHNLQVVPSDFGIDTALLWVLMVVVGGLGYRWGVVLASALFALLPYALAAFGNGNELNFVVGALLAAATIVFNPGGVGRQLRPLTRWLSGGPLVARHRSG